MISVAVNTKKPLTEEQPDKEDVLALQKHRAFTVI